MSVDNFILDKEYIKSLIPENFRNTWVFERVADLLSVLLSEEIPTGNSMLGYYNDLMYYFTDFKKLTVDMKKAKLRESGYSYLLDSLPLTDEALDNIGTLFTLIKILKGRKEGLELILNAFGILYDYKVWNDDPNALGPVFTATLRLYLEGSTGEQIRQVLPKIKDLVRSYTAPLTEVLVSSVSTVGDMYSHFSAGYRRRSVNPTLSISRKVYNPLTVGDVDSFINEELQQNIIGTLQ